MTMTFFDFTKSYILYIDTLDTYCTNPLDNAYTDWLDSLNTSELHIPATDLLDSCIKDSGSSLLPPSLFIVGIIIFAIIVALALYLKHNCVSIQQGPIYKEDTVYTLSPIEEAYKQFIDEVTRLANMPRNRPPRFINLGYFKPGSGIECVPMWSPASLKPIKTTNRHYLITDLNDRFGTGIIFMKGGSNTSVVVFIHEGEYRVGCLYSATADLTKTDWLTKRNFRPFPMDKEWYNYHSWVGNNITTLGRPIGYNGYQGIVHEIERLQLRKNFYPWSTS